MYNAAVIGLGLSGYKLDQDKARNIIWSHSKAYFIHSQIKLIAVSDLDQNNYYNFKLEFGEIPFYKNYLDLLKERQCDIVSICTPTPTHYQIIKNIITECPPRLIFVEKPMGNSLEESKLIKRLCDDTGVIIAVNYMRRWDNRYNIIRDYIKQNKLGNVQFIIGYGCTSLLTSTSHVIDLIIEFGGDIKWVSGELQTDYIRCVNGQEDHGGIAFIKFHSGAHGVIKGTSEDPYHYMFEISIFFNQGRITISDDGRKIDLWEFNGDSTATGSDYKILTKNNNIINDKRNERMLDAIDDIIDCIENNNKPKSNAKNAIAVHQLIESMKVSTLGNNKKVYNIVN